jgi:hypothetical protein
MMFDTNKRGVICFDPTQGDTFNAWTTQPDLQGVSLMRTVSKSFCSISTFGVAALVALTAINVANAANTSANAASTPEPFE